MGGSSNGSRLEVIIGDIRDRALLRKALRNVKYVFHLAALPWSATSIMEPGEIHAVNVEGTLNVLHGALREGVWRVVFASCASVYGIPDAIPISEEAPLRPTNLFAASKLAAETYCRAFHARHQLDIVTLRYFGVYGPRQRAAGALIPGLVETLRRRLPFVDIDDRSGEDLTYVDDAVAATLAAARAPRAAGRVINIGSGQTATIADVLRSLSTLLGIPLVPGFPRDPDAQPRQTCADTRLAAQLLAFTPRTALIPGLAQVVSSLAGVEELDRSALAPVGPDD